MKYRMTVNDQTYEVEIIDLHASPVLVTVDGERFEVLPEMVELEIARPAPKPVNPQPRATPSNGGSSTPRNPNAIPAPIPGVIVSIAVKVGEVISVGQEVCILEAMKMKNVIRANRAGRIEDIKVSVGQQVRHSDVLMTVGTEVAL
ncbi:MAG: acetyl-CoA carboxylase biotin carboxyl carrier protein subunit [Anaerolineae bacterium]|nr:acetyl-CoA carboxylase biotin carboxyl carrier protein subunit [Anaerolineae bacterium]